MTKLDDLLKAISSAVVGLPDRVEWFDSDDDLKAWVEGDETVKPSSVFQQNELRIPADVVSLFSDGALWSGCQKIASDHDCTVEHSGDELVFRKVET